MKKKNIVVIGGGTGVFTVLRSLRKYPFHLTAIVSMADDGGSTGQLREDFGALPPGDIRRALVALSKTNDQLLSRLFNYRFDRGKGLEGHSFGNLFLLALERITGDMRLAVKEAAKILAVEGIVIPVTLTRTRLFARLESGHIIQGESNIDIPKHNPNLKIKKVWLEPGAKPNPDAISAIKKADAIILGPGDLYTSTIPNLLVRKIAETIRKSRAKKIYIVNVMTKLGETNNFKARDFLEVVKKYLGKNVIDCVLLNGKRPSKKRLKFYLKEGAFFVEPDLTVNDRKTKIIKADLIREKGFIRHDPKKLGSLIYKLVYS